MPIFDYKAFRADGKPEKGVIEADTPKNARVKLKKRGLMVTEIVEKTVGGGTVKGKTQRASSSSLFGSGVSVADLSLLTRQLASLVKASVPLVESLAALIDQTENPKLKVVINDIRDKVNQGSSLSKALGAHPKVFDNVFVNMVEAGESSGTLGLVLLRLADLKEAQMRLRRKVVSGMTYPILMMVVATTLLIVIFTFVIPKLAQVFDSVNKPIPISTQVLIWVSNQMVSYWYLLLGGLFFGLTSFLRFINSKSGRPRWDRFKLAAPIFGPITRMVAVTRFSSTMGTLLSSGVPILTSMAIAKNLVGNVHIAGAIENARSNITEGQSIAEPLRKSGEFPPMVIHMISIGEKTGELPQMLKNVSESYEEQVNSKIEGLTALLEPAMIVGMGVVVGLIVLAIFVPLLEISNIS